MADLHFDVPDAVRDALGWVGGGLLAVSLLPQIVQLVRTRSAEDMSLLFGITHFLGNALTVVYMILVGALATWIPVVIEIVLCIVTMILKLVYEHTDWGKRQQQQLQQKQLQQWQLQLTEASKSSFCHPATIELLKSFSILEHPDPFTKCHKQGDGHAAGAFVSGFSFNHLASKHQNKKHAGSPYLADEDSSHKSQSGAMMAATISSLMRSAASAPNVLNNQPIPHSLWQLSSAGGSNHQSTGWNNASQAGAAAAAGFAPAGWPKGFNSKLPWYCQAGISHVRSVTPKHAAMQLCSHCKAVRPAAVGTRGSGNSVWFSAPGSSAAATKAAGYKISSNPLFRMISGRHSMVEELPMHAPNVAAAAADLEAQAATAAAAVATSSTGSASVLEASRLSDLELASGSGTTAASASSSAAAPAPAILLSSADGLRTRKEAVTAEAGDTSVDLGITSAAVTAAAAQITPGLSRLGRMNHRP